LIAGWRCSRFFEKPLVTTFHCELFLRRRGLFDALLLYSFACLEQNILGDSKAVIALTQTAKQSSRALQSWRSKITVIPNGVAEIPEEMTVNRDSFKSRLGVRAAGKMCLYVGALNYRKGIDVLLRAAALVGTSSSVQFLIVGKAPDDPRTILRTVRRLGLDNHVRLAGFVEESEIPTYMHAADLLIVPSRLEGFPLTMLEAFVRGLPVVASDIPPHREIIRDGWNGILYESGNPKDLAEKIESVLTNPSLGRRLSINSKTTARQFTWARVLDETEAIYREIAG